MKKLYQITISLLIITFIGCSNDSKKINEENNSRITGSIQGTTYIGTTNVKLDAKSSIMLGQGYKYSYILEHIWKITKENPTLNKADINFIINGDDGYGNVKTANWPHLIFDNDQIDNLRQYSDLNKMDWSEKARILDYAGMLKLKDTKGDLSPDVFK